MGLGREELEEAMLEAMIAEDELKREERDQLFEMIGSRIKRANNFHEIRDILFIMLNLIKEKT